jgi:hypothetical protein
VCEREREREREKERERERAFVKGEEIKPLVSNEITFDNNNYYYNNYN